MLAPHSVDHVINFRDTAVLASDVAGSSSAVRVGNGGVVDDEIVHGFEASLEISPVVYRSSRFQVSVYPKKTAPQRGFVKASGNSGSGVLLFANLTEGLAVDAQSCGGPGFKALDTNVYNTFFATTVIAGIKIGE